MNLNRNQIKRQMAKRQMAKVFRCKWLLVRECTAGTAYERTRGDNSGHWRPLNPRVADFASRSDGRSTPAGHLQPSTQTPRSPRFEAERNPSITLPVTRRHSANFS